VNISKTKKDMPKRKTPFFFTLKSLSRNSEIQQSISLNPTIKLNEQSDEVSLFVNADA